MKRYIQNTIKKIMTYLLDGFLIEFIENEMTFQIRFIEDGKTLCVSDMYTVPQIGSTVEVIVSPFPDEDVKLFLVENVIYSPLGAANKAIGRCI